jgi:trehalose 6-phosphate phosphatase
MRYLLEKKLMRPLEDKTRKSQRIFLFLDYDGTLTSIQRTPDLALLSSPMRRILKHLSSLPEIVLSIISGRALKEIERLVNLKGLNYIGNHGLEMKIGGEMDEIPQARRIRKTMSLFYQKIKQRTKEIPGVLLENKGLTLGIHYRLAKSKQLSELRKIIISILSPFNKDYELRTGKKVLEIRPKTRRNKGWAVNKIIRQYNSRKKQRTLYFYFGDDLTDEDAFELTNSKGGHSILVNRGYRDSQAHYYLHGPKEVRFFLTWLKKRIIQKNRENL